MSTESPTLEIMPDERKEALAVVQQNQLAPDTAASLQQSFTPLFANARAVLEKSKAIVVTDASQKLEIKMARECRLALRAIRIEGDKTRKSLKEESLRKSRAIDGMYAILLHLTESEENRLDEQEKFVARQEEARKAKLKADREEALRPYGLDCSFMALGEMPDETFAQLLENTRSAHEAKLAAARKAEEDRIRAENERLKEEQRIRDENARLKREADERAAAEKAEKERQAAIAAMELKRRTELHVARVDRIATYLTATPSPFEYADMTEERFNEVLAERKAQHETVARLAREKAEAEEKARKEREAAEALVKEQRRQAEEAAKKVELARKKELEALEAKRAKERAELEAKAKAEAEALEAKNRAEREAREKAEAELRAAKAAEQARIESEAKAKRDAELAPERDKLEAFAKTLLALEIPKLESEGGQIVANAISTKLANMANWLRSEAKTL